MSELENRFYTEELGRLCTENNRLRAENEELKRKREALHALCDMHEDDIKELKQREKEVAREAWEAARNSVAIIVNGGEVRRVDCTQSFDDYWTKKERGDG